MLAFNFLANIGGLIFQGKIKPLTITSILNRRQRHYNVDSHSLILMLEINLLLGQTVVSDSFFNSAANFVKIFCLLLLSANIFQLFPLKRLTNVFLREYPNNRVL